MKTKHFFTLRIVAEEKDRDQVSDFLAAVGPHFHCQGILDWSVAIEDSQKILAVESEFHDLSSQRNAHQPIEAWFSRRSDAVKLRQFLRKQLPGLKVMSPSIRKNQDWMKKWRAHYRSFKVGSNEESLWIVPAWQKPPIGARKSAFVWIHPGQAFGAGTHATTQACLEAFLESRERLTVPNKILDFGAGTGILGIAAIIVDRNKNSRLAAVEIDPEARKILEKNLRKNRVAARVLSKIPQQEKFDLIFANVLAPVLLAERNALMRSLKPDGILILSGILKSDAKKFIAEFMRGKPKLRLQKEIRKGDWACFVLGYRAVS